MHAPNLRFLDRACGQIGLFWPVAAWCVTNLERGWLCNCWKGRCMTSSVACIPAAAGYVDLYAPQRRLEMGRVNVWEKREMALRDGWGIWKLLDGWRSWRRKPSVQARRRIARWGFLFAREQMHAWLSTLYEINKMEARRKGSVWEVVASGDIYWWVSVLVERIVNYWKLKGIANERV